MKLPDRKCFWFASTLGLWLVCSGCGGVNVSKSVSPATFFMPGLMQAEPPSHPPEQMPATNEPAKLLAQGR